MAEYRGVGNVARQITKEYRGVGNVARQIVKAYCGVENVARQYLGNGYSIKFRAPTYKNKATVDSEYAGFDGDKIRLSFTNAVLNTETSEDPGDYICRMYIQPDESYYGKKISFNYTLTGKNAANQVWEVQMRNSAGYEYVEDRLFNSASAKAYSQSIQSGTYEIIIGVWGSQSNVNGEMIITDMYLGEDKIV